MTMKWYLSQKQLETIGVKAAKRKKPNSNVKRRLIRSTKESDEDKSSKENCLKLDSSTETEEFSSNEENESKEITFSEEVVKPKKDDFVLVEFDGKKGA